MMQLYWRETRTKQNTTQTQAKLGKKRVVIYNEGKMLKTNCDHIQVGESMSLSEPTPDRMEKKFAYRWATWPMWS